jgi:tetratricopeptide (TPR) repeat protein
MFKKILLAIFLMVAFKGLKAQNQNIKDLYFDYLQVRMEVLKSDDAISKAEELLKRSSELNAKQIANVNYHLGRLYEAEEQMEKAIPYYETSIKLTPGYYVPYRALGFYYFSKAQDLYQIAYRIDKLKQKEAYTKAFADFKLMATKSVQYLEKAQACDADDETLSMIEDLYKQLKEEKSLSDLKARLAKLSVGCITLLDDE